MNTDLTKEQLDEAERIYLQQVVANNKGYDAYVLAGAYWDYGQQLISMARRTLQAEERLGRAVEALKFYADEDNYRSISIRFAHEVDLDCGNKARSVLLSLDSPKDLPAPLPCSPPAHSDAQP